MCVKINSEDSGEANLRHRGRAEFQVAFIQPYLQECNDDDL